MSKDYVTVRTTRRPAEAGFWLSMLQGYGIDAVLTNEHFASVVPHLAMLTRGIEVQVPAEDEERARAVIDATPEGPYDEEEWEDGEEPPEDYPEDTDLEEIEIVPDTRPFSSEGVEVQRFRNLSRADFYLSVLQGQNIDAWLEGDNFASAGYSGALPTIALKVSSDDAEQAVQLLRDLPELYETEEGEEIREAEEEEEEPEHGEKGDSVYTPHVCPNCGSTQVVQVRMPWWLWVTVNVMFLGFPLFGAARRGGKKNWICGHCNWEWSE